MIMLDRKSAPAHAEINSLDLPKYSTTNLDNGLPLTILGGVTQEVLKIDIVFTASKWTEPAVGVAHFTSSMLEKGTLKLNAFQIADYFEKFGASIEIASGFDFTTLSLYTPVKNITQVFPVFIELFTQPSFPENELSILKNLFIQNLQINNEKTSYTAAKVFREQLFGKGHPYGTSVEVDDVKNISLESLKRFFEEYFTPGHAFITGNVNNSTLDFLTSQLSGVKATMLSRGLNQRYSILPGKSKVHIEKEGSTQTSLRLGKRTINKIHEDYPAILLANHILGGYFGSRLMKNIREEKGLTYGIYSSISTLKTDAYMVIGADVNKSNKELAVTEIQKELKELSQNPIPENEFKIAKNHLLGSLQLELASPFSVIEKIKNIQLNKLPDNFYSVLFAKINSIQPEELKKVATKNYQDGFIEVSVG